MGARYWRLGNTFIEGSTDQYLDDVLGETGLAEAKTGATPGAKPVGEGPGKPLEEEARSFYRRIVGKRQLLAPRRPDILYALKELGRRLATPCEVRMVAAKRRLRYLNGDRGPSPGAGGR